MTLRHSLAGLIPRSIAMRIKYAGQTFYRLRTGNKKINTNYKYKCLSKPGTHVFFGYYDISPFNLKTDEIIYNTLVEAEDKLHLLCTTLSSGEEREFAETRAWNWQQGCRLRWMPDNNREVIFNDFDGNDYFTRIVNIDTKEERTVFAPLYDISHDGRYGLSIDFERLGEKRPGYGYTCRHYVESDHNLAEEGIELVDIVEGTKRIVLTYRDIQHIEGCNTGNLKNNYINHLSFSPSGRMFLFFWLTADESWHKAFLLVHDLKTNETKLLENTEKVSHYVWQDDDNIICTAANEKHQWHYYNYNIPSGKKTLLNPSVLNIDGHPSIYNADTLLTDTYPDLMGFQRLYLANKVDGGYKEILKVYSDCRAEGEKRTDLHPRLDRNKKIVCVDSNQHRFRTMIFISLC